MIGSFGASIEIQCKPEQGGSPPAQRIEDHAPISKPGHCQSPRKPTDKHRLTTPEVAAHFQKQKLVGGVR